MKTNYLFLFLMLSFLLSCEGEKIDYSIINRSIKVNARIDGVKTRVTNDEWSAGDVIGIYMITSGQTLSDDAVLTKNAKYTTQGDGLFTPTTVANDIKFPIGGSSVDFIAYYPQGTVSATYGYSLNVAEQSNQAAIDVMYSNNEVARSSANPNVFLNFTHKLSKLVFNITPSVAGTDLSGLNAKLIGFNTRGTLSLIDGAVSYTTTKADIRLKVSGDGKTAEAIVIPSSELAGKKLILEQGGVGYEYDLSSATNITGFNSGYRYTYNLTLDPTVAVVSLSATASITAWSEGPSETVTLNKKYNAYQPVGAGTQTDPYSIVDAKNVWFQDGVWVKGYIVGYYTGSSVTSLSKDFSNPENVKETVLALADSPTETIGANTSPVQLPAGAIRDALNLKTNPGNLGKEIKIKGALNTYYGSIGLSSGVSAYELISPAP